MQEQPGPGGLAGAQAGVVREGRYARTAAATSSPRHVSSLDRWRSAAREQDPSLDGEQLDQAAERMRSEFYATIGALSGEIRRGKPIRRKVSEAERTEAIAREQNPGATDEEIARIARDIRTRRAAPAFSSPMHVTSPERWKTLARQQQPGASEEEIARTAAELKTEFYARAARTRAERRAATSTRP